MRRLVEPEILDELPSTDSRAIASRKDLRLLNSIMGHAGILSRELNSWHAGDSRHSKRIRIVELGAGDGSLMLRVARGLATSGLTAEVTLIDRQIVVQPEVIADFGTLGWALECLETDVFTWLKETLPAVDVILANLFLHHFSEEQLRELLRLAAGRTRFFIACEPRRSRIALTAARMLWLLGCNDVTRHDAVISVRAGFAGHELSAHWPHGGEWRLNERAAGGFSHCFVATKNA